MKIVVRAPNWLGDITMSLPFFNALGKAYPDDDIHVITKPEYEELFHLLPYKVTTHVFSRSKDSGILGWLSFFKKENSVKEADVFYVLPPSFSSALMAFFSKAKKRIGFPGEGRKIFLNEHVRWPKGIHRADEFLQLLAKGVGKLYPRDLFELKLDPYFQDEDEYLVINVNSEASSRRMPIEQWSKVLQKLSGKKVVFVGTEKEREWVSQVASVVQKDNEVVNLAGKTKIKELAQVMMYAKVVITNDSGPAHLAAFVGAPVVTWIGAADAINTVMLSQDSSRVNVFTVPLKCSPCLKNSCPIHTIECLTKIDMKEVYASAQKYL